MHFLYILHSNKADRYYVGESPDAEVRLGQHNRHHFKKGFTKIADDWVLQLAFECASREEAMFLERFIKKMKSKVFVMKIIERPVILKELLEKRK